MNPNCASTVVTSANYLPIILSICSILITAIVGYITKLLNKHFNIANDANTATIIGNAVARAGGIAYEIIANELSSRLSGTTLVVGPKDKAVAVAVKHVMDSVPDALQRLNLSKENLESRIENMVLGELGQMPSYQQMLLTTPPIENVHTAENPHIASEVPADVSPTVVSQSMPPIRSGV